MAEPVIVPVQLEVTDVDTSNINFNDASKQISKSLSTVKKAIQDAFSGIDASAINKPIEKAMTAVEKTVQSAESAYLRYQEALVRAGKSTQEYKAAVSVADTQLKAQAETHEQLKQSVEAALVEQEKYYALVKQNPNDFGAQDSWERWSKIARQRYELYKESKVQLAELKQARDSIDPLDFVKKAEPIQLEKVAAAFKKVLSAQENVNKQSEKFNQTAQDNRTTDEYDAMIKEAESYKKKLTELNEKSKYMEKYGATDKQWEKARNDADWYSSKLDEVIKKLRESVKTGEALRFGDGPKADLSRQINSIAMSGGNQSGAIKARAMKNESPYTEDYQKALNELDKLEKKVEVIREKSANMIADGASGEKLAGVIREAERLDIKVDEVKNGLIAMVNTGQAFKFGNGDAEGEINRLRDKSSSLQTSLTGVSNGAKLAQGGLKALGVTHPKLAAILTTAGKIGSIMGKIASGAVTAGKSIASGFKRASAAIGKVATGIAGAVKKILAFGKTGGRTSDDLGARFKKLNKNILMWGFGFRTAYYAIKRLRNIFVDSFKVMGEAFDEVGAPMKTMMESFNRLKGSLATAFQPLVSVVMPILTQFMNSLSGILEGIGKFTATLTGQKKIYKAVAKDINSVADAAGEANNKLGSYDKLEVISQDNNNNTGVEYEMQEIDVGDAASDFATMVKEAWENADFTKVGQSVTKKLVGVLTNVRKNIIPKITDFINKLLKSVNTFFDGFDSGAIGTQLGNIVNTIFTGIDWTQVGLFFSNLYNEAWQFFLGLINTIDWALVGESLNTGLVTFVTSLDFESLASMAAGLTTGLITAFSAIDWALIATTLIDGLMLVLQTVGEAMANSDNPLVAGFGEVILAISDAITLLLPAIGSIIDAISPIIQSILPVISTLLPPIAEIISVAVQMVMPVLVELFEAIMPILSELMQIFLPIILDLLTSLQPIFDALIDVVLPVIVHLLDACMPLIGGILRLVTNLLAPIMSLLGPLLEIVFSIIDPLIIILEPLMSILGTLCDVLGSVLRPILDALTPILSAVSSIFQLISPIVNILITPLSRLADVFKLVGSIITGILNPALQLVKGLIDAVCNVVKLLAGAFDIAFTAIKGIVDSAWAKIKVPLNSMLSAIESLANGFIRLLNTVIRGINKIGFDIPDWGIFGDLAGKRFGFNIAELKEVSIPKLAQGAVIPPNQEFLAMLGDQKHGTNIEAPLDTIKQALAEVLAELGGVGNKQPIILQVNGRTLAQVVWDEQEKRYKQTGKAMA